MNAVVFIMALSTVKSLEGLIRLESRHQSPEAIKELLRSDRLIRSKGKVCCRGRRMQEGMSSRERIFGRVWRCSACKKVETLLKGSYFENSSLPPFTILKMAYVYVEAGIGYTLLRTMLDDHPAKHTIVDWMLFFRDVMSKEVIRETTRKVGDLER